MGKVRYTCRAREDLLGIWAAIAPHKPSAADRVFDRIEEACLLLRDLPELGSARPDIAASARAIVIERWLAFYRLMEDGVQVVRIIDGARDLAELEWTPEK